MKKILTIAIMALSLPLSAWNLKAIAGLGLNRYSVPQGFTDTSSKWRIGPLIGVEKEFALGRSFAIETGLLYTEKGGKLKIENPDLPDQSAAYACSLLAVPLQVKIDFLKKIRAYLVVGPEIALVLSHWAKIEGTDRKINLKETTAPVALGLAAGTGVEFNFKKSTFFVEIRYYAGVSNLVRQSSDLSSVHASSIQLTVGKIFNFK